MRILLAEDYKANQLLARVMIEKAGHHVDVAANGAEAVDAMRTSPYDLVLMDIQMLEVDGFEATRQIRALQHGPAEVPIIAMTANAMSGDRERCLQAGMNDYMAKPFQQQELHEKIAFWCAAGAAAPNEEKTGGGDRRTASV